MVDNDSASLFFNRKGLSRVEDEKKGGVIKWPGTGLF